MLEFDTAEPAQYPVRIAGEEYVLFELTADAARARDSIRLKGAKFIDGKVTMGDAIGDMESTLVAKCLFKKVNGQLVPLGIDIVRSWSERVVSAIYDKLVEISPSMQANNKEVQEAAKNLLSAGTENSD